MNKNYLVFSLLILLFLQVVSCSSEKTTTKQIQDIPDHPRIIIEPDDINKISNKIFTNELLIKLNKVVINVADGMLWLDPLKKELKGPRLLYTSSVYCKRILYLSYSYLITKNEKYLFKAEEEMLAASAFDDWNPAHYLDVAEMTTALAIGYDWLYNSLGEQSRNKIKEAIIHKGLMPSFEGDHWWLKATNNWNQICNSAMVLGALAIYEDNSPLADSIINRASVSIQLPLKMYQPDGIYQEGPGYWGYGTTYNVLLFDAIDDIPKFRKEFEISDGFMKSAEFILHCCGPTGNFNYSDCSPGCDLEPALFWFSKKLDKPEILWHQIKVLKYLCDKKGIINSEDSGYRFLPLLLIWSRDVNNLEITKPGNKSWAGEGVNPVSFHRSSWDRDAIFIGIKGGSPSISHGHMDVGSFVMDANGVRWAIDLGAHNYNKLETYGLNIWSMEQNSDRWSVFRYNNFSHNTLTVNNQLQQVEANGRILRSADNENFYFTLVDITSAYSKQLEQAIRGIALVNNSYVIIRDELINGNQASRVKWNMLTQKNIEIINSNKAVISKDGKSLVLKILNPAGATIKTYSTDPGNSFEDKNPDTRMIGFEVELIQNQKENFVVVLVPQEADTIKQLINKPLMDW